MSLFPKDTPLAEPVSRDELAEINGVFQTIKPWNSKNLRQQICSLTAYCFIDS